MRDCLELIREIGGELSEIRLSGGGARDRLWKHIQADIYGQDVVTINASEGPAFGVALLAQVGTGGFATVAEACDATIEVVQRTKVNEATKATYAKAYPIYRKLYADLKDTFRAMAAL